MNPQEVVGVFGDGFAPMFEGATSMKAQIDRKSKVMQHPLENGASIIDHRVILANEIQLMLVLSGVNYRNIYKQIVTAYLAGTMLTVQTRVDSFPKMFIAAMPHEETPEMTSAVQVALSLQEAQFALTTFQTMTPRKASNTSTVKRGEQAPKTSVAYDIFAGKKK